LFLVAFSFINFYFPVHAVTRQNIRIILWHISSRFEVHVSDVKTRCTTSGCCLSVCLSMTFDYERW